VLTLEFRESRSGGPPRQQVVLQCRKPGVSKQIQYREISGKEKRCEVDGALTNWSLQRLSGQDAGGVSQSALFEQAGQEHRSDSSDLRCRESQVCVRRKQPAALDADLRYRD